MFWKILLTLFIIITITIISPTHPHKKYQFQADVKNPIWMLSFYISFCFAICMTCRGFAVKQHDVLCLAFFHRDKKEIECTMHMYLRIQFTYSFSALCCIVAMKFLCWLAVVFVRTLPLLESFVNDPINTLKQMAMQMSYFLVIYS